MTAESNRDILGRGSFWAAVAFYVFIGFEFVYMASPFAAFFYSVYRPGLNFFEVTPFFGWLTRFFMPHIAVETASPLIDVHEIVGTILAVFGFAAFFLGAGQVYYYKLRKKGAVIGGLYRIIRHPQYAAFILCGFGLLVLWPRYLVLVMFVTMLFGYYWLARIEERECERKYGHSYREYVDRTAMFLPLPRVVRERFRLPDFGWKRTATVALLYLAVLGCSIMGARMLESHSLDSLYSYATTNSVTVSAVKASPDLLKAVQATALADKRVQKRVTAAGPKASFLNYVLPAEWFVSEVPMSIPAGICDAQPTHYDRNQYKIVFTRVDMKGAGYKDVPGFLRGVARRTPLSEAWIDVTGPRVTKVVDPSSDGTRYENIPVALY
jgi:protein-S-isoprenylcysteine O-methyltransferase Ste14